MIGSPRLPRGLALVTLLGALAGCGTCDPLSDTTRLRVTVVSGVIEMNQVEVWVLQEGALVVAPQRVPDSAGPALGSQESVTVVVDDELAGSSVRIRVDGLMAGAVVSSGAVDALPVLGELVEVQVAMGAPALVGDGLIARGIEDCDDGNVEDGDGCSSLGTFEAGWLCNSAEPTVCGPNCGDGIRVGMEECDDGNVDILDGCSGCTVEAGWTCTGSPSQCLPGCGDGLILELEECDDGNLVNDDGCSDNCVKDEGYQCQGEPSVCFACGNGRIEVNEQCDDGNSAAGDGCGASCRVEDPYTCEGEPSVCTTPCGDGVRAGNEVCDDGNNQPGDGCSDTCDTEDGYLCVDDAGGTSVCATVCGDGVFVMGVESCEDGNTDSGDGCSAVCATEPGYKCAPAGCTPVCGDGEVIAPEACDDGNLWPGDGCSAACTVEPSDCGNGVLEGLEGCDDGDLTNGDGCSDQCRPEFGFACFGSPSVCTACGDGALDAPEECDDGNTQDGDGCSACRVDSGYSCIDDGSGASQCVAECGDGTLRPSVGEACDDGNTTPGDGCSGSCQVEPGWMCDGQGSCQTTCGDGIVAGAETCDPGAAAVTGCTACAEDVGFTCTGAPTDLCFPDVCGDGLVGGGEGCDDGNTSPGDGCDAGCAPEAGWSCPVEGAPCTGLCGDGAVVGPESCDDGNAEPLDGCSAFCAIETGFACDVTVTPSVCDANCGDGLVRGDEACDDANLTNNDGCSTMCAVETYWTCDDEEPSMCTTACGDGHLVGGEFCDDGNTVSGDGCSVACAIEAGYVCTGQPSLCRRCGDGVVTAPFETCDDGNANPGDGCDDSCQPEPGYTCVDDEPGPSQCYICGDGLVEADEACDDGNSSSSDGCSAGCAIEPGFVCVTPPGGASLCARCGDGSIKMGVETCDDQNQTNDDGCSSLCQQEPGWLCMGQPSICVLEGGCGNGQRGPGEQCDDFNTEDGDGCSSTCMLEPGYVCPDPGQPCLGCGDGILQANVPGLAEEECDDGNLIDDDGCDADCTTTPGWACEQPANGGASLCGLCGNGEVEPNEQCDNGEANDDAAACTSMCQNGYCGDGLVASLGNQQMLVEACDDMNDTDTDFCIDCALAFCGDGFVNQAANEACDAQNLNADHGNCLTVCVAKRCGDGLRQPGEQCDPGDGNFDEACNDSCQRDTDTFCGGEPSVCVKDSGRIINVGNCSLGILGDFLGAASNCLESNVADAESGDVVYFPSGEYVGDVVVAGDVRVLGAVGPLGNALATLDGTMTIQSEDEGNTSLIHVQNLNIMSTDNVGAVVDVEADAWATLEHVVIGPAEGIGVRTTDGGRVTLRNAVVAGNTGGGIDLQANTPSTVTNTLVHNNGANNSNIGGLRLGSQATVHFSTIVNNRANDNVAAGIECNADIDVITLRGLIVHNNDDSSDLDGSCPAPAYSNVGGPNLGDPTITHQPPAFEPNTIYRLSAQSPCIDWVPASPGDPVMDVFRHPRPHPSSNLLDCGWDESAHYEGVAGSGPVMPGN